MGEVRLSDIGCKPPDPRKTRGSGLLSRSHSVRRSERTDSVDLVHFARREEVVSPKAKLVVLGRQRDSFTMNSLSFLLVCFAKWMNRRQQEVIKYLREEVQVLQEQLGKHPCEKQFPSSLNTITWNETTKNWRIRSSGLSLQSFQLKVQCTVVKGPAAF